MLGAHCTRRGRDHHASAATTTSRAIRVRIAIEQGRFAYSMSGGGCRCRAQRGFHEHLMRELFGRVEPVTRDQRENHEQWRYVRARRYGIEREAMFEPTHY